jgi:transcriptional regulator with XRE-family HTH domain
MRQERKKKDWTLSYIANEIGVSNQAISKIETLKSDPSYDVLVKLENLFNLSHRELLQVVDEKSK